MICEIIPEPKGAKGITNLGQYLVGARGGPGLGWERLSSYVLGTENERGEIVADVRMTNCRATEIGAAVAEMAASNARCTSSKAPRVYHFVISLSPGESLSPEQFKEAEQRYVNALGLSECQRISATHLSKEHMHRHVAVATASAPDGKNRRPRQDYAKAMAVSVALEREFGLKPTNHERGTGRAIQGSFLEFARENAAELIAAKSWAELHDVAADHGIYVKQRGAGLVLGSIAESKLSVRASKVSRDLSFKALTDRLGEFEHDTVQRAWEKESSEFGAYRRARWQHKEAFRSAYDELRSRQRDYTAELNAFYAARIKAEMEMQRGYAKRYNIGIIVKQREAAHAKRRKDQKREREALKAKNALPTYAQWRAAKRQPSREQERGQEMER